jgi:hypothetical protein
MLALSLSTPPVKTLTTLLTAAAASAAFLAAAPHSHATGCLPEAIQPATGGGNGWAQGYLPCGGSFTIRLVNNAGSTLGEKSNSCPGACNIQLGPIKCSGAIVHTWLYVNVNGTGMSDTSSTRQC